MELSSIHNFIVVKDITIEILQMIHQNHKLIVYHSKVIVKFTFKNPSPVFTEPDGTMMTSEIITHLIKAELLRASAFHMPNRNYLIYTENVSQVHALQLLVICKI